MRRTGVRIGNLAQPSQDLPELPHAPLAEVLGPFGFDLGDDLRRQRDRWTWGRGRRLVTEPTVPGRIDWKSKCSSWLAFRQD